MIKIVIDTLGADRGLTPIALGVARALSDGIEFFPVLVGPFQELKQIFDSKNIDPSLYEIVNTDKFILNSDPPTCIFGGCDETSMAIAYERLKHDSTCNAMLSSGNTGALLVGSICRLGLLPGLKFPVLASALPCNGKGLLCLLDCGSNIECTADDLALFARMGNVFSKTYCGIDSPKIGLMSVGRERQKGTPLIQSAYEKINALNLNFVGNVEGNDIVSGYADVIVTDGFSGNLLLKCAESVGKAAIAIVKAYGGDLPASDKIQQVLSETFDFNSRGAATFLGTKKTVVKMHGNANASTVIASIEQILRLEKAEFSKAMKDELNSVI